MIGRNRSTAVGERVRHRRGAPEGVRPQAALGTVGTASTSLLLTQFRQFCARLLQGRDLLERISVSAAVLPVAPPVAEPVPTPASAAASAAQAAMAAAESAIAAAQAEAEAKIAAALGKPAPAAAPPPVMDAPAASPWIVGPGTVAAERDAVRASLLALLEQQVTQATALGGAFALGTLREAQFVMASLADEVLLTARWTGKGGWRLLEEELFRSHASGELFFRRLDALLALGDAGSVELAMVYLQALALDFRGMYRNNDPMHKIAQYRRQLYTRIFRTPPELATGSLMPPEDSIDDDNTVQWLPNPYRWWGAVAGVFGLWLLASFVLWMLATSDLSAQLNQIEASARHIGYRVQP